MANRRTTAWDYIQPWDIARFGEAITDTEEQRRWSGAVFLGGGLPYMWNKCRIIKEMIYERLELAEGEKVLIIGEAVEPSGFANEIRDRVGASGEVNVVDFIDTARTRGIEGIKGKRGRGTWRYEYTNDTVDEYYDCVAVLQGVQHSEDWRVDGEELLRVMKPGRRMVMAEIAFGPEFERKLHSDMHIETILEKVFYGYGSDIATIPYWAPEELMDAFEGLLSERETFAWKGIELFWGRKDAGVAKRG